MRVEAGSTGLILNGGFRTQRYAWADIESFRVLAQRWSGRGPGLFVLLRNGTMVQVPLPYGGGAVRSSRVVANLERVRAELERVRSRDA
ncbi:MAG: PH domain-containing protein [Acidimicrobiales bacterium]